MFVLWFQVRYTSKCLNLSGVLFDLPFQTHVNAKDAPTDRVEIGMGRYLSLISLIM